MADAVQVPVHVEVQDGVALITLDSPPVNALGAALRGALAAALDAAESNPDIRAIVIRAAGKVFSAGADIREFGKPAVAPGLSALCLRIENCRKPVIAALQGAALGGGAELALAAHYRVALTRAQVGLPEVNLGLLPGAGGTQRLPRLVGAAEALRIMMSGQPVSAPDALTLGLVDLVTDTDASLAALDLAARGVVLRPTLARPEAVQDPVAYQAAVRTARAATPAGPVLAPRRIIDCVEAAQLLPPGAGLEFEATAFGDCLASESSAGLRHVFLAERRAARFPEAGAVARSLESAGVVGGGPLVAGIMAALIGAGMRAVVVERDREALIATLEAIAMLQERAVERGLLSEAARDADWARLGGSTDLASISGADLVIEATDGTLAERSAVLQRLGQALGADAVLATTAGLGLSALAAASGRAADVIGLQFGQPDGSGRLVEVGALAGTAPEVIATGAALARKLGRIAVRSNAAIGMIAPRLWRALFAAADRVLLSGASPNEIDAALRAEGFSAGPFQTRDLGAGPDTEPDAEGIAVLVRASGQGFYRPGTDGPAVQNAETLALIGAERDRLGITPRRIGGDEIERRCFGALINEGARLLQDRVALRPSDIDVVSVHGMGLARWRGGILKAADLRGLMAVRRDLLNHAPEDPAIWEPHLMIGDLIKNGRKFGDLNES